MKKTIDFLKEYDLFYEKMDYGKKYYNQWNGNDALSIINIGLIDIHHLNFECNEKRSNFCVKNKKFLNENIIIIDIVDIIFKIIKNIYEVDEKKKKLCSWIFLKIVEIFIQMIIFGIIIHML